jgi:hypothetical protein
MIHIIIEEDFSASIVAEIDSEVCKVLLLLFGGHAGCLCGLGVAVEVLGVGGVSDLGHPGRGDLAGKNRAPVHSSKPFMRFYVIGAILYHIF